MTSPHHHITERSLICCPICGKGADYVHLGEANVRQGNLETTIDRNNSRVRECNDGSTLRGSVITLNCWSECGHQFHIVYRFHKGQTTVYVVADNRVSETLDFSELWRD